MANEFEVGGRRIELRLGDITRQDTAAIANAANGGLLGGGGVDGAIHRAAGPGLLQACREAKKTLPGGVLATGHAVLTPGFDLRAAWVIHCVGPVYAREGGRAPDLLASCYREALRICRENAIGSVSFPSISTGVYGYPVQEAAPIALATVRSAMMAHDTPRLVRFVLFDDRTFEAYCAAAQRVLGGSVGGGG
jgi:O-acetyl-ADP-ribose deacetylase (regulator of RNase III)